MKLEIGYKHSFEIREEIYFAKCSEGFSVLYLSDFHFNRFSNGIAENIIASVNSINPDIVLLGGDYADTAKGLFYFKKMMNDLAGRKNVFAIAGNHDYFSGVNEIKTIVEENKAVWLERQSSNITLKGVSIRIDGNLSGMQRGDEDFSILCLHKPADIDALNENYNLVFAGHLHGGQFVLWQSGEGLYPGKLFYKWNTLSMKSDTCHYYLSKGLGDTLPVRYNCKKDMIFVNVKNN